MLRFLPLTLLHVALAASWSDAKTLQIFVMAGQSNMEGQGVVDFDHPKYYNGGRGTLNQVIRETDDPNRYAHVKDENDEWVVRDDVSVSFQVRDGIKRGPLSIGFTGYPGKHHIGPEFQFGHVIGDYQKDPVLIIKTAWGGKSLHQDFRPPSAIGPTGPYFEKMVSEIRQAIADLETDFPNLPRESQLAGFVWFQGWNDMFDEQGRQEYEQNLVHLIHDVRRELKVPKLPVVIGELGNGGPKAGEKMLAIRNAQLRAAMRPEFKGSVAFVQTTDFARPAKESPNVGHGHHWFGNAESYFLIGEAMGLAMVELLEMPK